MPFAAIAPGLLSWPFAHCAKAILCLVLGHSHLLIAPRPFYALRWGIPICSLHQGHSMPCAGAFSFAYRTKAILCLVLAHSNLLIPPRPLLMLSGHHCFIVAPSWCASIKLRAVGCSFIRNPPALRCWALIQVSPLSIPIVIVPRPPFAAILLCLWQRVPRFFAKIPLEQEAFSDYSATAFLS
jgi:hypothetical protein